MFYWIIFFFLSGYFKVRVANHHDFQDIAGVVGVSGCYSTTELYVDTLYDIHIQKIGNNYKAYMWVRPLNHATFPAHTIPFIFYPYKWMKYCLNIEFPAYRKMLLDVSDQYPLIFFSVFFSYFVTPQPFSLFIGPAGKLVWLYLIRIFRLLALMDKIIFHK